MEQAEKLKKGILEGYNVALKEFEKED